MASKVGIKEPIYVFVSVALYLANGIFAQWRVKEMVEQSLDAYAPAVLHAFEVQVYPMSFALNKLMFDLDNEVYKKEYAKSQSDFLLNDSEDSIPKRQWPDLTLDFLAGMFILASVLLLRSIWPYKTVFYWGAFWAIVIFFLVLVWIGFMRASKKIENNKINTEKLNTLKKDYLTWRKSVGPL